jgi:uncharacterized protein (TIGR02145 family)
MKTKRANKILCCAALSCMVTPAVAQTVDVTIQCGQTYTINSTMAATAGATYRWLENGSTVTGAAANYTVPKTKSVGVYTYIRQAKSEGCADWQNSNAFTVEVQNKNDDGVCINGLTWAKYNVDERWTFAETIKDPGKLYQFNRTTAYEHANLQQPLPEVLEPGDWSPDSTVCPAGWRIPNLQEINDLINITPICNLVRPGCLLDSTAAGAHYNFFVMGPNADPVLDAGPAAIYFPISGCFPPTAGPIRTWDALFWSTTANPPRKEIGMHLVLQLWDNPPAGYYQGARIGGVVKTYAASVRCVMD